MIALYIIPVLLSGHIKEFTDLHIEASASGFSDLSLCHGSYPFFNSRFPEIQPIKSQAICHFAIIILKILNWDHICSSRTSAMKPSSGHHQSLVFIDFCYNFQADFTYFFFFIYFY